MKKRRVLGMMVLAGALILGGCGKGKAGKTEESSKDRKLKVVTSFYPMYDFTKKIAGDKAEVTNLVPAGTEPHDWEPSTSDLKKLEEADVFVYNGAGMEGWAEDILESLGNKDLTVIEASKGLDLMEGKEHHHDEDEDHAKEDKKDKKDEKHDEHDEHDGHGEEIYDPHVWLNPLYARIEMENIMEGLAKANSANKETYKNNFYDYQKKLEELDEEYKSELANVSKRDLVTAHEAFGYLCKAYDLNQVGIEGLSPDSEPDPERMHQIMTFAKEHQVTTIFFEELVNPKVAKTIADELGVDTAVLNPIEGLTQKQIDAGEDYFSIMKSNLETLKKALK